MAKRRGKAEPEKKLHTRAVRLFRVTFEATTPRGCDRFVLARDEDEAESLAEEPDRYDIDWDATARELSHEDAAKMLRAHGEDSVGDHPTTGEEITLAEWLENHAEIEALAAAQEEFDALPKLWPGIEPKLIPEALEALLPQEAAAQ